MPHKSIMRPERINHKNIHVCVREVHDVPEVFRIEKTRSNDLWGGLKTPGRPIRGRNYIFCGLIKAFRRNGIACQTLNYRILDLLIINSCPREMYTYKF